MRDGHAVHSVVINRQPKTTQSLQSTASIHFTGKKSNPNSTSYWNSPFSRSQFHLLTSKSERAVRRICMLCNVYISECFLDIIFVRAHVVPPVAGRLALSNRKEVLGDAINSIKSSDKGRHYGNNYIHCRHILGSTQQISYLSAE